jgi:hypothetical protein
MTMAGVNVLYRRMKQIKYGNSYSAEVLANDVGWLIRECARMKRPELFDELVMRLAQDKGEERVLRIWRLQSTYDIYMRKRAQKAIQRGAKP